MVQHEFKVSTHWTEGRESVGQLKGDILNEQISIPAGLGGNGTGTNPDELLVSAASSCYIISLAAVLERAGFTDIEIQQSSIGTAIFEQSKFRMDSITHYPEIYVSKNQKDMLSRKIEKLLKVADNNCMISNSIKGNVSVKIEPILK
ncbi:SACOL1771 family peroxiredoxin [Staphylococcus succinus]|uniref:SACOL1771 family peroxiredoxin n=1 Tax=Staphylococcus succinus TaxID=61015 RepID=UPI000B1F1343|nr:SACOL1771 family peroxiredoxin [Staphylococcus succinus]MBU0437977.1 SACOL1771 family peroxiredoxin [Staphylococcus succinus]MEB7461199.1 SACOL1771 family peroxiredoxin [Staphylococcus succinus]PTI46818.1 peroxiredoxin [Staphylococcus succinus]PTJ84824.1 peroxiredoxin [Staphylococcus succinus]